ncbi:MAG: hypothetical protein HQK53_19015 [Oligoflexia bacterium]|nr:hypothetical protein [Oligoflexia bacterium]
MKNNSSFDILYNKWKFQTSKLEYRMYLFMIVCSLGTTQSMFGDLYAEEDYLSIGVAKAMLRKTASFLGKSVVEVVYGDKVTLLQEKTPWYFVKFNKDKDQSKSNTERNNEGVTAIEGWIHQSSVGNKKSILNDIGEGEEISKSKYKNEVTLAGKGFSSEHESWYKSEHPNLNFTEVDKLETLSANFDEIKKFAQDGGLNNEF